MFYYYVNIMNPFLKLSNRECEVLSELLFYNDSFKSFSEPIKWKLIFDKDTRNKIQEELGISVHQFNNILSSLRKKQIINENKIKNNLLIYPTEGLNLKFIILNGESQKESQKNTRRI